MRKTEQQSPMTRWIAAVLSLLLVVGVLAPAPVLAADWEVHIASQKDLEALAESCRLDTWSQGKTVVLDRDITLDEDAADFLPIPTFGGTLEGGGHTISGLNLTGSGAGLFDTIQTGAVVRNLTVIGQVHGGDTVGGIAGTNYGHLMDCAFEGAVEGAVSVGGLVGINETTGQLIGCRFQGTVTGEHYVGGIAGQNTGSLVRCENSGDVNTTVVEVAADVGDLSLLRTTESVPAGTDIGGVAGFSSGMIQSCRNTGNVGYEHMGYNVGGIVGRQSGYLDGCTNAGTVRGRKDVGGIAGQMEPQVILRYDQDTLDRLWTELDTLEALLDGATTNAESGSDTVSSRLEGLLSDVGTAKDAANDLSSALTDWGNENIDQVNDGSARLSWVIDQAGPVLDDTADAAGNLEDALEFLTDATDQAEDTGEAGKDAVEDLKAASKELKNAASHRESAVAHINEALKLAGSLLGEEDISAALEAILSELNAAWDDFQAAGTALKNAVAQAEEARKSLGAMGDAGSDALGSLGDASEQMAEAAGLIESATDQIGDISETLSEKPDIAFHPIGSDVTSRGDALDAALAQVLDGTDGLRDSVNTTSDALLEDFRAIQAQTGVITDLLRQEAEETKSEDDKDLVEDISDEDSSESDAGRISGSANHGDVLGDVNAAGIVGSLSVEYDFDPEDDLTKEGNRSLNFQYKTLAVVEGCVNDGAVSAKKDYAGGIVGRMDLGAVRSCENYGSVESTGGDYVGGIAGLTRSTIRNCFVKCTLYGGDYVGGVVGMGENASTVSGCYTMVEIQGDGQSYGAVSSTETGDFTENYFVSDVLAGLGRISYTGQAEPISFASLAAVPGMPKEMTQFTLRFLVEDEELKTVSFAYGDSFGADVFPEIPVKEGSYAVWDTEDLSNLHFDKTVTAQYSRYVLTLPSEASRESGRPVFLLDGNFDENAVLTARETEQPDSVHGKTALEQWTLRVSDPSQETYTVRYLSPGEDPDGLTVYVRQDGKWKQASCSAFGSYLVFSIPAAEAEVAIVPAASVWGWWLAGGLALLILLVLLIRIRKKRRGTRQKPAAPVEQQPPRETQPVPAAPKARKKWPLLVILAVVLLLVLLGGIWAVRFFGAVSEARAALEDFAAQPDASMTLSVDTELDDQLIHTEMDIAKAQVEGHSVACISNNGISLYYADGAVILENGRAYEVSDLYPDYSQLPAEAARIFQSLPATAQRSGGAITCRLTAEGENARALLAMLLPAQAEYLADSQRLTVQLTTVDGTFASLDFTAEGTLTDEQKTTYTFSAQLNAAEPEMDLLIPDPVVEAVCREDTESRTPLSEDLVRLLSAWTDFRQTASCTADFTLEASLGNLSLDETMRYAQTFVDGRKITCIRMGDLSIYGSDGTFCDASGARLTAAGTSLADRIHLLEVLHQICLSGTFDCVETGNDTWLYTLALDQEAMEKLFTAAAPDTEFLSGVLTSGSVQLRLKDGAISEIDCSGTGDPDTQAAFSVKLVLTQTDGFEVPAAVLAQLHVEGGETP